MRGSLTAAIAAICAAGIIPAHAGLTECILSQVGGLRDHPRACGAHSQRNDPENLKKGSSPRMRGSLCVPHIRKGFDGIIPAHAGLTEYEIDEIETEGDHPRACGAHFPSPHGKASVSGSSPRMRGSLPVS